MSWVREESFARQSSCVDGGGSKCGYVVIGDHLSEV